MGGYFLLLFRTPFMKYLLLLLLPLAIFAEVPESTPPADGTFDVYIAAGQSNMAAIAAWSADVQQTNPRAHFRRRDVAVSWSNIPPISSASTLADLLGNGDASGSTFFGWDMARARPNRHTGVLNLAVSGSSLSMWKKGGGDGQNYYADIIAAVADAKAAGGKVRGFLWHQGEAGLGSAWPSGTRYGTAFSEFINDLRTDTGLGKNLNVVAGTIGNDGRPTAAGVNAELADLVGTLPNFALAATRHRTMGDQVHYDGHAQHELGLRYSAAMRRLEGSPEPIRVASTLPTVATFGTWFELPHWWQVTGGDGGEITWGIVGALPPGWTAQKDNKFIGGLITGIAPFAVTVRATDASGSTQTTYQIKPVSRPAGERWLSPSAEVGFNGKTRIASEGKRILAISEGGGNSSIVGTESLACLQFDLTSLPADFSSARLEFEIAGLNKFWAYTESNQRIAVRAIADDTWSESNEVMPATGAQITQFPITNLDGAVTGPVSIDLTDYIRAERSGDKVASLALAYDRDEGFNGGCVLLYGRRGLVPAHLVVTVPLTSRAAPRR